MSRNFDLLAEVERERRANGTDNRVPVQADRQWVADAVSSEVEDRGSLEVLRLVQNLFLSDDETAPRQVAFCSVDDAGSSQVCVNVARALAAYSSKSVCMVDGNIQSSHLSRILGADNTIPFSVKPVNVRESCVHIGSNLWFAGHGLLSDGRGALLRGDELKVRLAQLEGGFEYILMDAPAALLSHDAVRLGQVADAAILVIEAGRTRRLRAGKAKELLDAAGVNLVGTVLHNRSFPIPESLYKRL